MRKQKRDRRYGPTDEHLQVEIVSSRTTTPPSHEDIIKANEPYFAWLAQTAGQEEADRARCELAERLNRAEEVAARHAERQGRDTTKVVRVTRSA